MGFADEAKKAEQLAKEHPDQVKEAVDKGEQAADQQTGHRYDKQIGEGGDQLERHLGGDNAGDQQQQGSSDQQQQQPQPDQAQGGQNQ